MFKNLRRILQVSLFKIKYRKLLTCDFSVRIGASSVFEGMNKLHPYSSFNGELGYGSYVGPRAEIIAKVGRFTSIAPSVTINPGAHPFKAPYVTTSPAFFSTRKQNGGTFVKHQYFKEFKYADEIQKYSVIIGSDCWIGQNAFIVGGVNISDGAIVLAGSVITKDVPAYSIVGGVPAKVIGFRYERDTIEKLLEFKWWNKEVNWLAKNNHLLRDLSSLEQYIDSLG